MGRGAENPLTSTLFGHESLEDLVQKFIFLGDDRNIANVWFNGKKVKGKNDF